MARISFWLASSHWRGWQLSSEDNQHPRGTAPCDQAPWPRRCHSGATWELLVQFTSSSGKNSTKTHGCAQPEVREPSALLTPAQSSKRAIFTCGQSMPSRKEDRPLLAADSEPSEWCGAALHVI